MKTLGLLIHRFQPLMSVDIALLEKSCARFDHTLVLIAGAGRPARVMAPLSWGAIKGGFERSSQNTNFSVLPLLDTLYDDATWVTNVRICLDETFATLGWDTADITLLGQSNQNARKMLTLFPDWDSAMTRERNDGIESFYAKNAPGLDETTRDQLLKNRNALLAEQALLAEAGNVLGYPIVLNTVDAVITQSNHLLVVEREDGLLSLPGTHVNHDETGFDAVLRVAKAKAGLDMPKGALSGRLTNRQTFDHPNRSERGRVRTEAFVFSLPASGRMENIKPGKGTWLPFHACTPDRFFEDHYDVCQALLRGIACDQRALMET